jgi:hypothetical protein
MVPSGQGGRFGTIPLFTKSNMMTLQRNEAGSSAGYLNHPLGVGFSWPSSSLFA